MRRTFSRIGALDVALRDAASSAGGRNAHAVATRCSPTAVQEDRAGPARRVRIAMRAGPSRVQARRPKNGTNTPSSPRRVLVEGHRDDLALAQRASARARRRLAPGSRAAVEPRQLGNDRVEQRARARALDSDDREAVRRPSPRRAAPRSRSAPVSAIDAAAWRRHAARLRSARSPSTSTRVARAPRGSAARAARARRGCARGSRRTRSHGLARRASLQSGNAMRRFTRAACVRGPPSRAQLRPRRGSAAPARARSAARPQQREQALRRRPRARRSRRGAEAARGSARRQVGERELGARAAPSPPITSRSMRAEPVERLVEALGLALRLGELARLLADPVDVPALVLASPRAAPRGCARGRRRASGAPGSGAARAARRRR